MKKILSFILVFALILSMSVTAFAADTSTHIVTNQTAEGVTNKDAANGTPGWASGTYTNGTADGDDNAEIAVIGNLDSDGDGKPDDDDDDGTTVADVIAVDLEWEDMEWTYSKGHYDPNTMTSTSGWLDAEKVINVANRSNVGVTAAPAYVDDGVTGTALEFVSAVTDGHGSVTGTTLSLNKATEGTDGKDGTPSTGKITVSLDMTAMANITIDTDDTTLGTITVTIAKVAATNP